jgi:hypothetical protein
MKWPTLSRCNWLAKHAREAVFAEPAGCWSLDSLLSILMKFGMMNNNSISKLFKTKGVDEPSTKKLL